MSDAANPFLDDDRALSPSDAAAAILVAADRRYLLQLRDDKPGIFYPGHWGCFGGAVEASDASAKRARHCRRGMFINPNPSCFVAHTLL